jgi:putative transposase
MPQFSIKLSNHYHLVLHVNRERAVNMTDREVLERWRRLFSLPVLLQNYLKDEAQDAATLSVVEREVTILRKKRGQVLTQYISKLNYFAPCLNHYN